MKIPLAILLLTLFTPARAQEPDSVRLRVLFQQCHSDSVRGDYSSALKHWNEYQALKSSRLEGIKKQQLARLQSQYQTVKKDLEIRSREKNINLLSNQNRLTDQYLNQTRLIRTIIIVVGITVAILLGASLWQYRQKLRANRSLEGQEKAIDQQNHTLEALALLKDDLLAEKELLIKEIHHRVKNNLQVVISLLNTQSAYLNDPRTAAAIKQSQHRMQSISLIHQKLYQSESRAMINFREYVQDLVLYLRQSFDTGSRINFRLSITEIDIDVTRAVPLGLILNETITNALKHGFATGQRGDIIIELTHAHGRQLNLVINDNGCGLPVDFDLDLCESLGINLIKNMCREIDGMLSVTHGYGLTMMIKMPLQNDFISPFGDDIKSKPFALKHNTL